MTEIDPTLPHWMTVSRVATDYIASPATVEADALALRGRLIDGGMGRDEVSAKWVRTGAVRGRVRVTSLSGEAAARLGYRPRDAALDAPGGWTTDYVASRRTGLPFRRVVAETRALRDALVADLVVAGLAPESAKSVVAERLVRLVRPTLGKHKTWIVHDDAVRLLPAGPTGLDTNHSGVPHREVLSGLVAGLEAAGHARSEAVALLVGELEALGHPAAPGRFR